MRIGVLGTGTVGRTIGSALVAAGHDVRIGSRSAGSERAGAWADEAGARASAGTFADAAGHGEVVFNCTAGAGSLDALASAGEAALAGKLIVDVANPLHFVDGAPALLVANTDSLAEQIQRAFPRARVVKALNTMNAAVMVDPASVPGDHVAFVAGNEAQARAEATRLLGDLGWPAARVVDLGDLAAARGLEMYVILWIRMMAAVGRPRFNIAIAS